MNNFENGKIITNAFTVNLKDIEWDPHPTCKGVFLKHIIKGSDTNKNISCHFVKIEPMCKIESHVHDGKIELHEIIKGSGKCILDGKEVRYSPGDIGLIPENLNHEVIADDNGLFMFAKFTPALI